MRSAEPLTPVSLLSSHTYSLPFSCSDSREPRLALILTASTEIPSTSAASCTFSLRLDNRAPSVRLMFTLTFRLVSEQRVRERVYTHGTKECSSPHLYSRAEGLQPQHLGQHLH